MFQGQKEGHCEWLEPSKWVKAVSDKSWGHSLRADSYIGALQDTVKKNSILKNTHT